jgi:plastocyanin
MKYFNHLKFVFLFSILILISCTEKKTNYDVAVTEEGYLPSELTIETGDEITWTNKDDTVHSVSSGVRELWTFDSGEINPGEKFTFEFLKGTIGTHTYYCKFHGNEEMEGLIIVKPKGYNE